MKTIAMKTKIRPEIVYKLTAIKRDAEGNEISRRESAEQRNIFTNYGVEAIFGATVGDSLTQLAGVVGTGNAPPAVTDTVLQAFLAGHFTNTGLGATTWVDNGDGTGYVQSIWNTVFPAGVATGNISEVGSAFRGSNPTNVTPLCSRALVLDGEGNPTTFEVLADEELQLTQFFRRHISTADQNTVLVENGNNHTVTWRPWSLSNFTPGNWSFPYGFVLGGSDCWVGYSTGGTPVATLVPVTSQALPSQTGGTGSSQSNMQQGAQGGLNAYVPNSKKRQAWMRMPTGTTLLIPWVGFGVGSLGRWQCKIDPFVNKTNLQRFTFTMEFELDNTL